MEPRQTNLRRLAAKTFILAVASLGAQCHTPNTFLDVRWTCPGEAPAPLLSVWGASGRDVFAVGGKIPGATFTEGLSGNALLRYDGSGWREFQIEGIRMYSGQPETIHYDLFSDVWGSSSSDVFVVYRSLLHFDGATTWVDLPYYIDSRDLLEHPHFPYYDELTRVPELHGLGGSSASDVFAVGERGAIIHFDGADWRSFSSGVSMRLNSVWSFSPFFVFAVGESGTTLFYPGPGHPWRQLTNELTSSISLNRVWGSSAADVFAVGSDGTILHYDSEISFGRRMASGTDTTLLGVWGSSGNDVFAVGVNGTILHYDGSSWRAHNRRSDWAQDVRRGRSALSGEDPYPEGWTEGRYPVEFTLRGVWGTSGSDVFAVGDMGTILHYDGSSWSIQSPRVRVVLTRSDAAPDVRILTCATYDGTNSTNFSFQIPRAEQWTVNAELLGYSGAIVARDSAVVRVTPGANRRVDLAFQPVDQASSGSVVLRWTLNGSQPSDDLAALCRSWGADKVIATSNGGPSTSADCGIGSLAFTQLSGTATLHARLVDGAGVDVAPPKDVTVQVVPGAATDAYIDFQVAGSCMATGTRHNNLSITTSETWTARDSPHHLLAVGYITVSNGALLTIEPGATVCFAGTFGLRFESNARLEAGSDAGNPVMFTGDYDSTSHTHFTWGGIQLAGSPQGRSVIKNAIIEYASVPIQAYPTHPVTIDHTRIRRIPNVAVTPVTVLAPGSRVTSSTVEATGSSGSPTVSLGSTFGGIVFESRVINAPGDAIEISGQNHVLNNCEIAGSGHDGVRVNNNASVQVSNCDLVNNSRLAINNINTSPSLAVTADGNWWDPSDSEHRPTLNPPNGISANVNVGTVRSSSVILNY